MYNIYIYVYNICVPSSNMATTLKPQKKLIPTQQPAASGRWLQWPALPSSCSVALGSNGSSIPSRGTSMMAIEIP